MPAAPELCGQCIGRAAATWSFMCRMRICQKGHAMPMCACKAPEAHMQPLVLARGGAPAHVIAWQQGQCLHTH